MPTRLAAITFLDDSGVNVPVFPSQGLPGIPAYPSNGLPGAPVYPSQGLPGGPVHLPVYPFDPTRPDNTLPGPQPTPTPPIQIVPGAKFIVKWLACSGLILVPDNSLPPTPQPK